MDHNEAPVIIGVQQDLKIAVGATVDCGLVELYEYMKMRQEAELYLMDHPAAQRILRELKINPPCEESVNETGDRGVY